MHAAEDGFDAEHHFFHGEWFGDVVVGAELKVDNYLKYFKYSTELKFSYGLLDMVKQDGTEYTRAYRRLGSKMVTLVLCFE